MSRDNRLYLAWLLALIATIGSLYFSNVLGFNPCILCWYQRIAMYPLVLLLGIAAFRGDHAIRRYALPLALIGLAVALFHNLENWGVVPSLKACTVDASASCGTPWPVWGKENEALNKTLTIPLMSMVAFSLISGLLSWPRLSRQPVSTGEEPIIRP